MPEFYMIFARKIFFPIFWGWASTPSAPVSYAYDFSTLFTNCGGTELVIKPILRPHTS